MPVETLGAKQRRFARAWAEFASWIFSQGLAITLGESLRSDEQAEINAIGTAGRADLAAYLKPRYPQLAALIANNVGSGIRGSLHELKLAQDFNLFRQSATGEWQWLSLGTEPEWELLGRKWESMGSDHCWGGRFRDFDHVSIAHEGRK